VAVAAATRLFNVAISLTRRPSYSEAEVDDSVVADIGLDRPGIAGTAERLQARELERQAADRGWIVSFVLVLFAIHVSRMGFDRSALGILSPLVAVAWRHRRRPSAHLLRHRPDPALRAADDARPRARRVAACARRAWRSR
jgi:hypothetical protein